MNCPNCGAENSSDSKFCTSCGGPLQSTVPADRSQPEIVYAGFWRRVGAYILDALIFVVPISLILSAIYPNYWTSEALSEGPIEVLLNWVLPVFYTIIFWNMKGATPGKMIAKIRIVDSRTLRQPSLGSLIGRYFGYFISAIPLGLGFLWVAWDKEKRGFHDKVAGTAVILVRTNGTTTISPSPPPTTAVPPTTVATHRTGSPTVTRKKVAKKKVVAKAVEATPTRSSTSVEKSIPPVDIGPTCPNCGSPGWDVTGACAICSHSENKNLSLVTKDGVIISMGVLTARLNQDWAKQKLGEDGIFWDKDWQFSLERRNQDWVLIPNSAPTNDTLVDGVAVTTEMVLSDGVLLSVGNQAKGIQKTPLTVRLG